MPVGAVVDTGETVGAGVLAGRVVAVAGGGICVGKTAVGVASAGGAGAGSGVGITVGVAGGSTGKVPASWHTRHMSLLNPV